jgi:hypothetical protein
VHWKYSIIKTTTMENPGPHILNYTFDLNKSTEVEAAARRKKVLTGEKASHKLEDRIQNYLDRLQSLLFHTDEEKREKIRSFLREMLFTQYVVTPAEIAEYQLQTDKRIDHQLGLGVREVTDEDISRAQLEYKGMIDGTINKQKESLDEWIDYLLSDDAIYPDWLKYLAFRSILNFTEFDWRKGEFPKRSVENVNYTSLKKFPELNREALAVVLDRLVGKYKDLQNREDIRRIANQQNFIPLYAEAYAEVELDTEVDLSITKGKWLTYKKDSDAQPLVDSLEGRGTGWCTVGKETAQRQLQDGDIYVYYSEDEHGNPIIPRAAIRMVDSKIREVRGIEASQNLDSYIADVVEEKLVELPDTVKYRKRSRDMKLLTTIERRVQTGKPLTKDQLIFLYEIFEEIWGFGYFPDPRIKKLHEGRNIMEDALVIFECTEDQLAQTKSEITDKTKAYVGPLFPGLVSDYPHIEHIYTSFPKGVITRSEVVIEDKVRADLLQEYKQNNINIYNPSREIMLKQELIPAEGMVGKITQWFKGEKKHPAEHIDIVQLRGKDLGFDQSIKVQELYDKALELGFELCSPELAVHYRLQYLDQPIEDVMLLAMEPMKTTLGKHVLGLSHDRDGNLELSAFETERGKVHEEVKFLFRYRKQPTVNE